MSPSMLDAACGEYAKTIVALSARLANATANLVQLGEENEALTAKVKNLEEKLAAATPKEEKPPPDGATQQDNATPAT